MAANEQERPIKQPMSSVVEGKQAEGRDGVWQPAYEARRELRCVRCGGTIAVGEHFTRTAASSCNARQPKRASVLRNLLSICRGGRHTAPFCFTIFIEELTTTCG